MVTSVVKRRSPDFLKLFGTLADGTQITYSETLTGENAGFATIDTQIAKTDKKYILDESSTDYWYKVLTIKLTH